MIKHISILFLYLTLAFNCLGQLPYTWTTGVNPGWTSVNSGSGGSLNWNGSCLGGVVTTNCSGNYSNNQNTTYTSPSINATCTSASSISISFNISGNAEYSYDFLFCEYSTDGGVSWINFYGPGVGLTGNAGAFPGTLWTLPSVPTNSNFIFRFRFTSDPSFRYEGYKITNFSIICNTTLPIELISFTARNIGDYNLIEWSSATELNNDYYTIQKSSDGEFWETIDIIDGAGNSVHQLNYYTRDYSYKKDSYNYYRLKQTDFNGDFKFYNIVYVNNLIKNKPVLIRTVNQMGQDVDQNYKGLVIEIYEDGSTKKIVRH